MAIAAIAHGVASETGGSGFDVNPGIAPPEYLYLDNARVLAYLSQIEGGLSESERRTLALTREASAGLSSPAGEVGGSAEEQRFVERVVTPTATSRFYRLLERLNDKRYLYELDAADNAQVLGERLRFIPEGTFVRITNCWLAIPRYVDLWNLLRQASPRPGPDGLLDATYRVLKGELDTRRIADFSKIYASLVRRHALSVFLKEAEKDPRFALSCRRPGIMRRTASVDFLFPVRFAAISGEQSLIPGKLTIVGKVMRFVRVGETAYADRAALGAFFYPLSFAEEAGDRGFKEELLDDATVQGPGAVILPIAIYK